jgi:hypothetical protein
MSDEAALLARWFDIWNRLDNYSSQNVAMALILLHYANEMKKEEAISLLNKQIDRIKGLSGIKRFSPKFSGWKLYTKTVIQKIFGKESEHVSEFEYISYSLGAFMSDTPESEFQEAYEDGLKNAHQFLLSMIEEIETFGLQESDDNSSPSFSIAQILERFHSVQRQLRSRHDNRPTIEITDEYDVQNLLHALLKLVTDDIRPEEWTPSYAGSCSRMDFLLKDEQTVIETKMTRKGLGPKEVGDQLIIDITKYKTHPDCKKLICFVYDPTGLIANPAGMENDLSKDSDDLAVTVLVRPKA